MEYVTVMERNGGDQWAAGEKRTASGTGDLYTDGWLRCYGAETQSQALLLAVFLSPLLAPSSSARFFSVASVGGRVKTANGLTFGFSEMVLGEELTPPVVTPDDRIAFSVLCTAAAEVLEAEAETAAAWADAAWASEAAEAAAHREAHRAAHRDAAAAWAESAWAARRAAAKAVPGGAFPLGGLAEKAMEVK